MAKQKKPVEVFTDGSHFKGICGFGVILLFGDKVKKIVSKTYTHSSVTRMEIKAIVHTLETIKPGFDIYIYSDNKGVIDTINKWVELWVKDGNINSKGNSGLWMRFLEAKFKHQLGGSDMSFCWIRSHTGHKYNEMVDKLAKEALKSKEVVKCDDNN